jgi:phage shock protein C
MKNVRKLYRSQTDKKIAGVCGGLAEYFNIDVTVVRIVFVLLLLPGGLPGFIPYLLLWALVPLKPALEQRTHAEPNHQA